MFDPDTWGTVADWAVVATAVAAVWFGREQLKKVVQESKRQADVARAELMLQIDQIFEGAEIGASRMAIRTLRNECEAEATASDDPEARIDLLRCSARIFSRRVSKLHEIYKRPVIEASPSGKGDPPHIVAGKEYTVLMALPYWMETVGLLTRKELMARDDVLDLYDAVYVGVLTCFDAHIEDRRRDPAGPDDRFLENATWLRDRARERNDRIAAQKAGREA